MSFSLPNRSNGSFPCSDVGDLSTRLGVVRLELGRSYAPGPEAQTILVPGTRRRYLS
jgi:hypothetical protein